MDLASDPKSYIDNLISTIKKQKTAKIAELIAQIDRLQAQINAQKEELKEELLNTFLTLETEALQLPSPKKEEALEAIAQCKLKSLELLGILAETAESAMIAALERGENIEETIFEIAKDLTFESIDYEVDRAKVRDVASTLLEVASTIAAASVNHSDEILRGTIFGIKSGIRKSIEKFNEIVEFTPPEARALIISHYEKILQDLDHIDTLYKEVIEEVARKSEPGIKEKMIAIANSENLFEKLKEDAQKAMDNLKRRFETINPELKAKALEAKELGLKAFALAKEKIDKAIKEAKDAFNG